MKIQHRQRPRKLPYAGVAFAIAAFAVLGADVAAAQECFFIFCKDTDRPSGYTSPGQPQPDGQREPGWQPEPRAPVPFTGGEDFSRIYGDVGGEPFPVPALQLSNIDQVYLRRTVDFPTDEAPGTIVIDPHQHFLYFVEGGGRAIRYGVGVGRTGFGWSGVATIHDKQAWPDWYPPKEMIARQPELQRVVTELQSGLGMPGGPRNPLGARALYLWQGNKDTLYRIHGTVEPWTIGHNVSSGCIRMINQDVMDLFERAPAGAKVVVLSPHESIRGGDVRRRTDRNPG
jgi:lipoprotein-anchoring transpeptidase ErfK/SrfK